MRETNIQSIEKRVYELEKNGGSGGSSADKVNYNNSISGLVADNVQDAIDEIHEEIENIKHHYSTEEKIIGEWVDGSLVYEKTYTGTTPANYGEDDINMLNDNINIKNIINVTGFINDVFPLGSVLSVSANFLTSITVLKTDGLKIYIKQTQSEYANKPYHLTIQYTKNE